ncbi:hypothetical protein Calag_1080 [Caldisphaera lagunensis DSM 15908]|uniref:Uncharacterized protein n=1 Tax=Caldisphaera lagunensis (strain DSM 15908 / JCM 11604 / ANMR 0165 / IC-154) TaxID=1056495 RepID=L0ACD9_CALLD|nr:hypothetical protein [Caldisphaera lagunensis]AFZ70802.1 hypothetical protein Calag_1080 [Caldisphaera lagunensis DSM 15908]
MNSREKYGAIALLAVAFVLVMAFGVIPISHAATPVTISSGRGAEFPSIVSPGSTVEIAFNFTIAAPSSGYYQLYLYYPTTSGYVTEPVSPTFFLDSNAQYLAVNVTLTPNEVQQFVSNIEKYQNISGYDNLTVFIALNTPYTPTITTTAPVIGTNQFTLLLTPALQTAINGTRDISYYTLYNVTTNRTVYKLNVTLTSPVSSNVLPNYGYNKSTTNVTLILNLLNSNYMNYPIMLYENQTEYNKSPSGFHSVSSSDLLSKGFSSEIYSSNKIYLNGALYPATALPLVTNVLTANFGLEYSYFEGNVLQLIVYNASSQVSLTAKKGYVVEYFEAASNSVPIKPSTSGSLTENVTLYSLSNLGVSVTPSTVLNIFPSTQLSSPSSYELYPGGTFSYDLLAANFPSGSNITSTGIYFINPVNKTVQNTSAAISGAPLFYALEGDEYAEPTATPTYAPTPTSSFTVTLPLNDPYWGSPVILYIKTNNSVITYAVSTPETTLPEFASVYPIYYVVSAGSNGTFSELNTTAILLGQYVFVYGYGFYPNLNVSNISYVTNGSTAPVVKQLLLLSTPMTGSNLVMTNENGIFYFVAQVPYTGSIANLAVKAGSSGLPVYFNVSTLSVSNVPTYNKLNSSLPSSKIYALKTGDAIIYINPQLEYVKLNTSLMVWWPEVVQNKYYYLVPYNATQPFSLTIAGKSFSFSGIAPVSDGEFTAQIIGANATAYANYLNLTNSSVIKSIDVTSQLVNGYGFVTVEVPNANGGIIISLKVASYEKTSSGMESVSESSPSYSKVKVLTAYEVIVGKMPIYAVDEGPTYMGPVTGLDNTTFIVLNNVPITVVGWGFVPETSQGLEFEVNGVPVANVSAIVNGYAEGTMFVNQTNGFILSGSDYSFTLDPSNVEIATPTNVVPAASEELYYITQIIIPVNVIFSGSTVSVGEPYIAYVLNPLITMQIYNSQLSQFTKYFALGPSSTEAFVYNNGMQMGKVMSGQNVVPTPPTMQSFLITPPMVSQGQLIFDYNVSLIFLPWPSVSAQAYGIGEAGIVSNTSFEGLYQSVSALSTQLSNAQSSIEANITEGLNSLGSSLSSSISSLSTSLSNVNSTLESQISSLSSSISSLSTSLSNDYSALSSSISSLSTSLSNVNSTLESQISSLSSSISSLSTSLSNVNSTLSSKVASISSSLSSLESTVSGISSTVSSLSTTVSSLSSTVSSLSTTVSSLSSTVSSLSSLPSTVSSLSSTASSASSRALSAEYYALGALIVAVIVLILAAYMAFAKM